MLPKFLTVQDLAAVFQKDEDTIRRWLREGDAFPHAYKLKGGWYVPIGDVNNLMRKHTGPSDPADSSPRRTKSQSAGFVTGWKR